MPAPFDPSQPTTSPAGAPEPTRVMVVDDSALFRRFIYKSLDTIPDLEVIGFATNGRTALDKIQQHSPDVVTLDVEMPVMDGLETLKKLKQMPNPPRVIMLSAGSSSGADYTIKCLELGADDFVLKPSGSSTAQLVEEMSKTLGQKVQALTAGRRRMQARMRSGSGTTTTTPKGLDTGGPAVARGPAPPLHKRPKTTSAGRAAAHTPPRPAPTGSITRRTNKVAAPGPMLPMDLRTKARPVEAVVIGVSTGGPQALADLLPRLPASFPLPVAVVQHMPPKFTASLAQSLDRKCPLSVKEAEEGERLAKGTILIAPGGRHMKLVRDGYGTLVHLTDDPPEQACRPAVNHLFWSAAEVYSGRVLAVILTGMGEDGLAGGRKLTEQGAALIAQDEATCTVWGMPKRVSEEGVACATYPLDQMAQAIIEVARP